MSADGVTEKRAGAERVQAADAEAEALFTACWERGINQGKKPEVESLLFAIAAELRAQRIARRPGAGQ